MVLSESIIVISPIGSFDSNLFESMSEQVGKIFFYPTEIMPILPDVAFALDSARNQYHSTMILEKLSDLAPSHAIKVLGVTKVDLFIPILTYVYGEAQLGGKASIISTHRLNENLPSGSPKELACSRLIKEAIHELGHTFQLRHCRDRSCIMHYCRNVTDVDRKSDQLCRYCRILLDDEIKRLSGG